MRHFILRVERAPSSGDVPLGATFEVASNTVVVGRGAAADVRLSHASVSTRHLTLEAREESFVLRNESEHGSTWVDRRALEPGEEVHIEEVAWAQVGRVLLHISRSVLTTPVATAYSLPPTSGVSEVEEDLEVFLEVEVGLHASVRVRGHEQPLFPMALRVLWRLCQSAGEVVSHQELLDALSPTATSGGMNLPQNITYLRDMFEEAIAHGELSEEELRDELEVCLGRERVEDMERRVMLRTLIQSVRGQGYRLNLTPAQVMAKS